MAFVFQKIADFKKTDDGDYACDGFESYQTNPPPISVPVNQNKTVPLGGRKRTLDQDASEKHAKAHKSKRWAQ